MRKIWRGVALGVLALAALLYVGNTNHLAPARGGGPVLLAHRGIAQQFDTAGLTRDGCTATRMLPPTHSYLENTIASMQASFEAGADIVELDVHPTTDGQFAVFHDWTVDCRTDGRGVTREHSMADLRKLDLGYGYTADGGKSFPFRGKGIGLMPTLDEVLQRFPDKTFLINVKSNDPTEGTKLAAVLNALPPQRRATLLVYGGDNPIATLRAQAPDITAMSRASLKTCLLRYLGTGWTGMAPDACRSMVVFVPINIAPWLWGWPNSFLARMEAVGSPVFVLGDYRGGEHSTGIDSKADIERLPAGYAGGVFTNEIEAVAAALKPRKPAAP